MILISVHIPEPYLKSLENLVTFNKFPNRAEAIRCAIRDFLKEEFYRSRFEMRKQEYKDMNKIRYIDSDGYWVTAKVVSKLKV